MITVLKEGVHIHTDAEGSIVQSVKVTNKQEKALVSGMVAGHTQIVKVFPHTETNEFSVTGCGDITMASGIADDVNITLISGGVIMVDKFDYEQKLKTESQWSYDGCHYPHAA